MISQMDAAQLRFMGEEMEEEETGNDSGLLHHRFTICLLGFAAAASVCLCMCVFLGRLSHSCSTHLVLFKFGGTCSPAVCESFTGAAELESRGFSV